MNKHRHFIFGLQRSGTNYLEMLMKMNFQSDRANRTHKSWKHSIDIPKGLKLQKDLPLIIIYKNPYTWAESIAYRNRVDWIKSQTKYPADEPGDIMVGREKNELNLTNLMKTYVHFHETWIYGSEQYKKFYIRYEDLLESESRTKVLTDLQSAFGLTKHQDARTSWRNPKIGGISQSNDYDKVRHEYYKDMKPQHLTKEHISEINRVVDKKFFKFMRYETL